MAAIVVKKEKGSGREARGMTSMIIVVSTSELAWESHKEIAVIASRIVRLKS
jgi:hypothetical protein